MLGAKRSLDWSWENLPVLKDVDRELRDWGIWLAELPELYRKERWVRFLEVDFGMAPL